MLPLSFDSLWTVSTLLDSKDAYQFGLCSRQTSVVLKYPEWWVKNIYCKDNALRNASEYGNMKIVKLLIEEDEKIFDHTILCCAIGNGHTEIVKYFLEKGFGSEWALYIAVERGLVDIVRLLLENKVIYDSWALQEAARIGNIEILKMFIEKNICDNSALYYASKYGQVEAVKFLIQKGFRDDDALIISAEKGFIDIVKVLLEAGIRGDKSLLVAAEKGHLEIVNMLLNAGIHYVKALSYASKNGHSPIVDALFRKGVCGEW